MKHPEISAWTDYVRAVADTADRAAMQSHLDDGCTSCRATVAALERVVRIAAADAATTPPAGILRSVIAFFDVQHPQRRHGRRELFLRTAFDSATAPAPTGTRAQGDGRRHLIFESDEYTLELSVDYTPGAVDAVLRGQILEAQGAPRSHTPVFLVGDGEVVGRAISEQHGAFEMSGRLDDSSELWVFPDDQNRIRVSLKPQH